MISVIRRVGRQVAPAGHRARGGTQHRGGQRSGRELKGIGPKHAEMLKSNGVDSIKELRRRNAARLSEMIETRHGKVIGLSEKTCQTWIDEAKAHTD